MYTLINDHPCRPAQLLEDAVARDGLADHWSRILRGQNGRVNESRGVSRQPFACPRLLDNAAPLVRTLAHAHGLEVKTVSFVHKSRTPPGAIQPIQNVTTQGMSGWQSRMIEVVGGIVRHA